MSVHMEFEEELDLTPLIDVAFLLQIFFMVTSTIDMAASINMPLADHGTVQDLKTAVFVTIFPADTGPELFLSDGKRENGPATMEEATAYFQKAIAAGNDVLVIKADKDVDSGYVEEVARAAAETEGIKKYYFGVVDNP